MKLGMTVCLAGAVLVSACSFHTNFASLDQASIEKQVKKYWTGTKGLPAPDSVECPGRLTGTVGKHMTCDVTLAKTHHHVTVTVGQSTKSDPAPLEFKIDIRKGPVTHHEISESYMEALVQRAIEQKLGPQRAHSVRCPAGFSRDTGTTMTCVWTQLLAGSNVERKVTVTIIDYIQGYPFVDTMLHWAANTPAQLAAELKHALIAKYGDQVETVTCQPDANLGVGHVIPCKVAVKDGSFRSVDVHHKADTDYEYVFVSNKSHG